MIWPEAVAYQTSFEGDFKRIMHEQRALYNLTVYHQSKDSKVTSSPDYVAC